MKSDASPLTFRLWMFVTHWPGDEAIAEQLKALEQDGRNYDLTPDQRATAWLEFGLVCEQQLGQQTFALEAYCEAMCCRPELFAGLEPATRERMIYMLDPLGGSDQAARARYCTICGTPIPRQRSDRRRVKTCNARSCRMFARGRGTFGPQTVIKEPDPVDDRQLLTSE